ncbi:hypothetical protein NA57DRAFT_62556 [Rhizodiscina lignyota]|uniref:Uncharacterized protein n=1 Tax=Rhizodiscina lignyota TaxID=1504668 RepID=A0A9P4IPI5_9PEZI|nr:hypothetical protein NA57DRAFT_62556 [Rhizodiscina lignyota]
MVLSIIIALCAAPGLMGTQEAIRQAQAKEKREEHRARRCKLVARCVRASARRCEIDGRQLVLRNNKLYIDTETPRDIQFGHPFTGYYLPYPEASYEGLVTTVRDDIPMLNWIYIDKETNEVKYGVRVDAQPNLTGPFDCTRQDRRLTFEGWEGFVAAEESPNIWAVYFDVEDDGLKGKVSPETRILEIELSRKETRYKKDAEARKEDQTTTHDEKHMHVSVDAEDQT